MLKVTAVAETIEFVPGIIEKFGVAVGALIILIVCMMIAIIMLFKQNDENRKKSDEDRNRYTDYLEDSHSKFLTALGSITDELKQVSIDVKFLKDNTMIQQAVNKRE